MQVSAILPASVHVWESASVLRSHWKAHKKEVICTHARARTDIIDSGKVGLPKWWSRAQLVYRARPSFAAKRSAQGAGPEQGQRIRGEKRVLQMLLVCIAFWPIRFYWRILYDQRHLAIMHALNKQRFPSIYMYNRHDLVETWRSKVLLTGEFARCSRGAWSEEVGNWVGELLLVCPMDGTIVWPD